MAGRLILFLFMTSLAVTMSSCKPTRYVQKGDLLVTRNIIHLNQTETPSPTMVSEDDLLLVLKQKPNRKILGLISFHLGVWNYAQKRNPKRKLTKFLKDDIGEAPVLFEEVLFEKSIDQVERYLKNHGHFDATVTAQAWKDSLEVEMHYYVNTGPQYKMRKLGRSFELDDSIKTEFLNPDNKTLNRLTLGRGSVYDTDILNKERVRLSKELKNLGFYTFDKIHVQYDIDTNMAGNYFDVMVKFRSLRTVENVNGKDSLMIRPHLKHRISKVTINQNFNPSSNKIVLDSTMYKEDTYLYLVRPYVRPARISRNLFLKKDDVYSLSKMQYTYDRISALNNYRFIDIRFEPGKVVDDMPYLDMIVNLSKAPKQAMTVETVGTNRSGNLGITTSLNYKNKNLFRGAEQFAWKVYGGVEWQNTNSNIEADNGVVIDKTPINTYEYGTQLTLTIPDFLLRSAKKELPRIKEPKTSISLVLDRQGRPQYDRNLINTSFQWSMRTRPQDQLIIAPIDVSVIQLDKTPTFAQQLAETNNALLISSYSNHIIPAGRITYSYSTQDYSNNLKNYYYYRTNFETAGNLLRLASNPLGLKQVDGSYLIDTIAFAQYVKLDFEFIKKFVVSRNSNYLYRVYLGSGVPLANRPALPFERSFFAGGSQGMRAWRARSLGPGSVSDTTTYGLDQVGELQLEMNFEYRFKLIKQLEGAVFADVGNIWFWNDTLNPKANFRLKTFWREIALAPGVGIRYNLNFFILRFDAGLQLKDPSLPQGERWAFFQPKELTNQYRSEWRLENGDPNLHDWKRPEVTFNIGINYPF